MKKILLIAAVAALAFSFTGCKDSDDEYPSIKTVAIYSDGESVTLIADLTDTGSDRKAEAGIVWSTETSPTITDESDEYSGKERRKGKFTITISGLRSGVEYTFRPFAKGGGATSYGKQFSFIMGDETIMTGEAGALAEMAVKFEFTGVSKLRVGGYINQPDFLYMRDDMSSLGDIDLSLALISAYTYDDPYFYHNSYAIPVWAFAIKDGSGAVSYNDRLAAVTLPTTLWFIDDYAFAGCRKLRGGLEFPEETQIIGEYAYYGCSSLDGRIVLPEDMRAIYKSAFEGCSGLTGKLSLPESITVIGERAFYGCDGLSNIEANWTTPIAYTTDMLPLKDVYVPAGSEEAYRNAPGWSAHNIFTKL